MSRVRSVLPQSRSHVRLESSLARGASAFSPSSPPVGSPPFSCLFDNGGRKEMNKLMRENLGRSINLNRAQDQGEQSIEICQGCRKPIRDRYLLNSLGRNWHEDCLKCTCCEARLGEVGASLYTRANLILCKRDYLRLFGSTGYCSACNLVIPAFEMVMRAKANVYHLECFACQLCGHRFCVGDRFYLCDNKILCESDYNERIVFGKSYENSTAVNSSGEMPSQCGTLMTPDSADCNNNGNNKGRVL